MKIPFVKYIEVLLVCKYTVPTVLKKVSELNIPLSDKITAEMVTVIFSRLMKSNETYFKTPDSLPEPEWLRSRDILKMVAFELKLEIPETVVGIEGAYEILKDPDMYRTMTSLGLAKVNEDDIELVTNTKYNIHYSDEDIKEFLHYFFNTDDWSLTEKKEYVNIIQDKATRLTYDVALTGDKDYLIWKLGIAPDKSFDGMLKDIAADAYYSFKEKLKREPEEAQKWATMMIRLSERMEKIEKDTESKRNLFEHIHFVINGPSEENGDELVIKSNGSIDTKPKKKRHITTLRKDDK